MSEHRYDIRISETCADPNPLMADGQDPDNFTRFQTRERCALEIAAYVFKETKSAIMNIFRFFLFSFLLICKSRIRLCFHNKSVHYS